MALAPRYGYRVVYGGEFTIVYRTYVPTFDVLAYHVEKTWPALKNINFSLVCYDGAERSCNITKFTDTHPLFAFAGREFQGPLGLTYHLLDIFIVPGLSDTSPSRCSAGTEPNMPGRAAQLTGSQEALVQSTRYRYQVSFNGECFVSSSHDTIDFSLHTVRKDIIRVWPELTGDGIHLVCYDKAGNSRKIREASMAGLFDCFGEETVRFDGRIILILKLEVGFTEEVIKNERPFTGSVSATPPPSVEGDHRESSVCQAPDPDQSVSPTSDSWVFPVTGEK
ncbi:hypothetical protein FOZ61_008276 [Perkinsus olseni]|uniref:Uncharacterized protein n=1 Tax=Perkinsus olseni TaxID=32597 RepID=A0A7J6M7N2_PEROL|nr:hypothetical protein FOL46_006211 [Perkinsus olseni]KAF4667416.1 hypothetical protein FOZ61_008276 [Perkinsus olseni]